MLLVCTRDVGFGSNVGVVLRLQLMDEVTDISDDNLDRCDKTAVSERAEGTHDGEVIGHVRGRDGEIGVRIFQPGFSQIDAVLTNYREAGGA